jgi:hypothetical protein
VKEENIFRKRKYACWLESWSEKEIGSGKEMFIELLAERRE